jgi:hypothetical protein
MDSFGKRGSSHLLGRAFFLWRPPAGRALANPTPPRTMRTASALVLLVTAVGCSAKEADKTAIQQADPTPNVVEVHGIDYAFHAPDTVPAGMTTFKFTNGGKTFHHAVIARLDSGKTMADLGKAMENPGPPPAWLTIVGGPNSPDPAGTSNATLELTEGNYVMLCFVDVPEGKPHIARGMVKAFTVTAATKPSAPAPTADIDLTLSDFKFTLSKPITAGTHTFAVRTEPGQPHEIEIIKLAAGKTEKDLLGWMEKMDGPPPGSAVGGISTIVPGSVNYFTADMPAGSYVFICFLPDAKDPKHMPHFMKGMVQTVEVK